MNNLPKIDWILVHKGRFNKTKTFCSIQTTFFDQSTVILGKSSLKNKPQNHEC